MQYWPTAGTLISSIASGFSKFEFIINLKAPQLFRLAVPQCCSPAPTKSSKSGAICCGAN